MIEDRGISPIFDISKWQQFPCLKWQHLFGSMLAHCSKRLSEFPQFLSTPVAVSTPMLSQCNFLTTDQLKGVWFRNMFRKPFQRSVRKYIQCIPRLTVQSHSWSYGQDFWTPMQANINESKRKMSNIMSNQYYQ